MPLPSDHIRAIQHELARRGFDPGNVDGLWGRRTEAAVRRFQAANGLLADGIAGPKTRAVLFAAPPAIDPLDDPGIPWFQAARRLLGLREKPGAANDPAIMDMARGLNLDYRGDDVAWCGLFTAHCIAAALPAEPLPNNPLWARGFQRFGVPCSPRPGAIAVFWRISRTDGRGHVGFYAGDARNSLGQDGIIILGGNQDDRVSFKWMPPERLLGYRWPSTAPLTAAGAVAWTGLADDNGREA